MVHPKKQTGVLLSPRHSLQEALEFAQKIKTKCKWTAAIGVGVEKFLCVLQMPCEGNHLVCLGSEVFLQNSDPEAKGRQTSQKIRAIQ